VAPNNNEAQIYGRSGDEWNLKQTLSEVRCLQSHKDHVLTTLAARQAHHCHLMGTQHEPYCDLLPGP
jgi:hypothetical protein